MYISIKQIVFRIWFLFWNGIVFVKQPFSHYKLKLMTAYLILFSQIQETCRNYYKSKYTKPRMDLNFRIDFIAASLHLLFLSVCSNSMISYCTLNINFRNFVANFYDPVVLPHSLAWVLSRKKPTSWNSFPETFLPVFHSRKLFHDHLYPSRSTSLNHLDRVTYSLNNFITSLIEYKREKNGAFISYTSNKLQTKIWVNSIINLNVAWIFSSMK